MKTILVPLEKGGVDHGRGFFSAGILGVVLILGNLGSPVRAEEYDFRKTWWGMTQRQVLASENAKPFLQNEEEIWYNTELWNKKVGVEYEFVADKLVSSAYALDEKYTNLNDFIKDYEDFKRTLTKEYGPPYVDNVMWQNEEYKNKPESRGLAVSLGHLQYVSKWDTETTVITCILVGGKSKSNCVITYDAKEFQDAVRKVKQKKVMDRFK